MTEVTVEQDVLADNARNAHKNRQRFSRAGIYVLNMMSGPGAGKTTLIERTIQTLKSRGVRLAIIAGDLETRRDADRLERHGAAVVQVNTGGACHLEAHQIAQAVGSLDGAVDLLIIENVGNMVCPAEFDLGETDRVMIFSCSEGHDKPGKYPLMFREAQAVVINKVDLLPYTDFDIDLAVKDIRALNADGSILRVSARTGEGLEDWFHWLEKRMDSVQKFEAGVEDDVPGNSYVPNGGKGSARPGGD